jgi:hypothetical protein
LSSCMPKFRIFFDRSRALALQYLRYDEMAWTKWHGRNGMDGMDVVGEWLGSINSRMETGKNRSGR